MKVGTTMIRIFASLLLSLLPITLLAQPASLLHNSNLRSGPSSSSRIVLRLPAGTPVTVISKYPREGYVRVQVEKDDSTGWVLLINAPTPAASATAALQSEAAARAGTRVGDPGIYPTARLTPGTADPAVTQSNIAKSICNKGWTTDLVRPSTSVTKKIKTQTMKTYGFTDAANHYELDHLMSLQVGGCPDCVENLWPEAYGDQKHPMTQDERAAWNKAHPGSAEVLSGSLEKDLVENHVHDEICVDILNAKMSSYAKKYPATVSVTLQRGQEILKTDWYSCYLNIMDGNKPCK